MDVKPIPGLEQLPYAEVWFHELDDARSARGVGVARMLGKTGLEVWTTDRTPEVVAFLEPRGYDEVRRYVISELDVAAAPDPDPPAFDLVTFAERPDLADALYELAQIAHADQPGRSRVDVSARPGTSGACGRTRRSRTSSRSTTRTTCSATATSSITRDSGRTGSWPSRARRADAALRARSSVRRSRGRRRTAYRRCAPRTRCRLEGMLALNRRFGYRTLYDEIVLAGPGCLKRCSVTDFFADFGVLGGGGEVVLARATRAAASSGSSPTAASRSRIRFTPRSVSRFFIEDRHIVPQITVSGRALSACGPDRGCHSAAASGAGGAQPARSRRRLRRRRSRRHREGGDRFVSTSLATHHWQIASITTTWT